MSRCIAITNNNLTCKRKKTNNSDFCKQHNPLNNRDNMCSICLDDINDPMILTCKHVFCKPCICKSILYNTKCPYCRNPLNTDSIFKCIKNLFGKQIADKFSLDVDMGINIRKWSSPWTPIMTRRYISVYPDF